MSELFRKEVIDKQGQRHLGDVFLTTPLSFLVILGLIILIMLGLASFALFGEYARKERVTGVLVPDKGLVRIVPQQPGVFEQVFVESGEHVRQGQILFEIRYDSNLSGGQPVSAALLGVLNEDKSNLTSRITGLAQKYELTRRRLEARKHALLSEAARMEGKISIQHKLLALEKDILDRTINLQKNNVASVLEVSTLKKNALQAQQGLNTIINDHKSILTEIKDIDEQIALLPFEKEQIERALIENIGELEQTIITTTARRSGVMLSPINGKIASITVRDGQTASLTKTAITILPIGGELQAELFVPTRAAGFVKVGQSVRLLYDAFPYQKFGFYSGQIKDVSRTVIHSSDVGITRRHPEPVFLVTVKIDAQFVEARHDQLPLQAGMSLSADIVLEERKIWEWVLEPFLGGDR